MLTPYFPRPTLLAQVIRKMAASIQPPDPERFKWERHTSVIEPQGFRRKAGSVLEGDKDADALEHRWASSSLSGTGTDSREGSPAYLSFWRVIAAAAEDPVPPLPAPCTVLREQVRYGELGYMLRWVYAPELCAFNALVHLRHQRTLSELSCTAHGLGFLVDFLLGISLSAEFSAPGDGCGNMATCTIMYNIVTPVMPRVGSELTLQYMCNAKT